MREDDDWLVLGGSSQSACSLHFHREYPLTILVPAGLQKGNGFAGKNTLKKLIELKAKYSL